MPVPILKLPFLALKNVMAYGEDIELLTISQCSRKADRAVKVCARSPSIFNVNSYDMVVLNDLERFRLLLSETENASELKKKLGDNRSHLRIVVSDVLALSFNVGWRVQFKLNVDCLSKIDQYKGYKIYLMVDGICVPFIFSDSQLYAFWNERLDGLQFFVKFFEKTFRLEPCDWEFQKSVPDLKPLVCYLNTLAKKPESYRDYKAEVRVETVSVEKDAKLSHSDYNHLLETVIHPLHGRMNTSEDFKFNGQFAAQSLVLTSAHWFDLKCLLKCIFVQVEGSQFTNKQVRAFVQKWSTGKLPHMESVQVELKEKLNYSFITKGLKFVPRKSTGGGSSYQGTAGGQARVYTKPHMFELQKIF